MGKFCLPSCCFSCSCFSSSSQQPANVGPSSSPSSSQRPQNAGQSSPTTMTDLNSFLHRFNDVSQHHDLIKFIEDLLKNASGEKCEGGSSSEVGSYIQAGQTFLEFVDKHIDKHTDKLSKEKDSIGYLSAEAQKALINLLRDAGKIHWVGAALSVVGFVLTRINEMFNNKRECLEILKAMVNLGKQIMELNEEMPEQKQKLNKAVECIVVGCCLCTSQLATSKIFSDRLTILHIASSFNCVFCDECEESVDHLFVSCSFAYQCWSFVLNKLHYSTPLQNNLWDLFQAWPVLYPKSLFANLWKCIPALVVWAIWWERNKRIFRKESLTLEIVLEGIERSISEVTNSSLKKSKFNPVITSWDSQIIQRWKHLFIPDGWKIGTSSTSSSSRKQTGLRPPDEGYWKLNFDGASRGNPGPSSFGACIRNSDGDVVAIIVSPLPINTNNMAEAQALLAGLILAKEGNFRLLHIEGDSSVIINACIHRNIFSWKLKYILIQIWRLLDECMDVCISHTYREGNQVADFLSNLGCDGLLVSSLHPLSIIEKHAALKKLIQEDKFAGSCSRITV